jgi:hypothetical protein
LVADDSLFAVKGMLGKLFEERLGDELLSFDVDLQLDVVGESSVDVLRAIKILPKQFAGFAGGVVGGIEIMLHEEVERLRS